MFSNIKIISRSNNLEELPNMNWTPKTRIACICNLELGLGEQITFYGAQAPLLEQLIDIYKALEQLGAVSKRFRLNEYEFLINQCLGRTEIEVSRMNWNKSVSVLLKKTDFYARPHIEKFKLNVLNQLFYSTNESIRKHYGQLLLGDYNKLDDFPIGTKIETVITKNVKTFRRGFVVGQGYSKNWASFFYIILTEGKIYNKRYRKEDLLNTENRSD
ncbi:MAG: hypothetical protein GY810_22275 [Aureispira sp.]|nr:hypothetical protein [Aureispira sp.]